MSKLTSRTNVLFNPDMHKALIKLADQKEVSLGHLIRESLKKNYGKKLKQIMKEMKSEPKKVPNNYFPSSNH